MTKLFLLLALLATFSVTQAQAFQASMPCETYEPNCDGSDDNRNNDEWDGGEPERPADPDGPDYEGGEDEI